MSLISPELALPPLPAHYQPLSQPIFMAQGQCNSHWLLDTASGFLVWRQFGEALGSHPLRETQLLEQLQGFSWVPNLIQSHPTGLLLKKAHGHHPQAYRLTQQQRSCLLDRVIELWQQPCKLEAIHYPELIWRYWQASHQAASLQPLVKNLISISNNWEFPAQLTHHDLHSENLLLDANHWTLLDWEFAAPGNPWIDAVALDRWLNLTKVEKQRLTGFLPQLTLSRPWQDMALWLEGLDKLWQARN